MSNIHTSISTLSIFAYNQIAETHDYSHLLIDRKVKTDRSKLDGAWQEIVMQYINATSHRQGAQDIIDLQKAILELTIEYNNINTLIFCCRKCFEPDVIKELNDYGFDVTSKKDLDRAERGNKTLLTELREKQFALSQKLIKGGESVPFEKILHRIASHYKMTINPRETTCKEWIAIEDNYIDDLRKK